MTYEIDLEKIKAKEFSIYVLRVFNEGRYLGKNIITIPELFKLIMGYRPTFRSETLLFKYKFSAVRTYLRRQKFGDIWIEVRQDNTQINKNGARVRKIGYSIAQTDKDYFKAIEVIDDMISHLDKGKQNRLKIINQLKEQKSLHRMFDEMMGKSNKSASHAD